MAIVLSLFLCQQLCIQHIMAKLTGVHDEFGILSSKVEIRYGNWGSGGKQAEICNVRKMFFDNWKRTG